MLLLTVGFRGLSVALFSRYSYWHYCACVNTCPSLNRNNYREITLTSVIGLSSLHVPSVKAHILIRNLSFLAKLLVDEEDTWVFLC